MKTRRSVPSWVPTLFFVMGNLLIIGASAQLLSLIHICWADAPMIRRFPITKNSG